MNWKRELRDLAQIIAVAVLIGLLMAVTPLWGQDTTIVANPGDSLVIENTTTTTITTVIRVIPGDFVPPDPDTLPDPPPPPPPDIPDPIFVERDINFSKTLPADAIRILHEGTVCFAYNATAGGLLSIDANGQFPPGHITIWFKDGGLQVRSQNSTNTFTVNAPDAFGKHKSCYVFGPAMRLYVDGNLVDTNAHLGSWLENDLPIVVGGNCVQCRPDDRTPSGSIVGLLELLEVFDFPMSDSLAKSYSFFVDTTVAGPPPPPPPPSGTLALANIDTLTDNWGNFVLMIYALPDIRAQQVVTYVDGVETGRMEAKVSPCYPGTSVVFRTGTGSLEGGPAGTSGRLDPFNAGSGEWGCHMPNGTSCTMQSPGDWHAVTPCAGRTVRMTPKTRACSDPYYGGNRAQCWVSVKNPMLVPSPRFPRDGQPHEVRVDLLDVNDEPFATYEATWTT